MDRYRILVLGGYGHFGGRICRRLAEEPHIDLIVAGRNAHTAEQWIAALPGNTDRHRALQLDLHAPDFARKLREAAPDLVIHTSGPFQGQDHQVASACLDAGCDYIDLADGRDFVEGFHALDRRARKTGRTLVTGASTLPGVSSAVIAAHEHEFRQIDTIRIGITPGQNTPRGAATIAAVLGYCGQPFRQLENSRWTTRHGWQDLKWRAHPRLGHRLWGACDVPDLGLLPARHPSLRTVSFHAGLELPLVQLGLWLAGWAARGRLVRDWSRHAVPIRKAAAWLDRFGSSDGGMFVTLSGTDPDGRPLTREWWLTACNGDGPFIPCVPAIALARKLAAGETVAQGARPCLSLISLDDFAHEVRHLDIDWVTT